jgi:yecA family protein
MGRLAALLQNPAALEAELAKCEASEDGAGDDLAMISYVNGLITAAIVGPERIPESEWLPLVCDGASGLSEDEAELLREAMLIEYGAVLNALGSREQEYEPFFWEDGEGRLVTRDWAEGFLNGVALREAAWKPWREGDALFLFAFVNMLLQDEAIDAKIAGEGLEPEEAFAVALEAVPELIRALYGFS